MELAHDRMSVPDEFSSAGSGDNRHFGFAMCSSCGVVWSVINITFLYHNASGRRHRL